MYKLWDNLSKIVHTNVILYFSSKNQNSFSSAEVFRNMNHSMNKILAIYLAMYLVIVNKFLIRTCLLSIVEPKSWKLHQ